MTPSLDDLEARLRTVEAVQDLILRILSTTRPMASVLEQHGATEKQELAFYALLDELSVRVKGPEQERPTFPYFLMMVEKIFPELRNDREFITLLVDTLQTSRAAYRELARYAEAHHWPTWT
jgi:hypothetical protein